MAPNRTLVSASVTITTHLWSERLMWPIWSGKRRILATVSSFSPLFIGEGTSSKMSLLKQIGYRAFQSPLHRGRHFICIRFQNVAEDFWRFSPLFIGEGTSSFYIRWNT